MLQATYAVRVRRRSVGRSDGGIQPLSLFDRTATRSPRSDALTHWVTGQDLVSESSCQDEERTTAWLWQYWLTHWWRLTQRHTVTAAAARLCTLVRTTNYWDTASSINARTLSCLLISNNVIGNKKSNVPPFVEIKFIQTSLGPRLTLTHAIRNKLDKNWFNPLKN